MTTTKKSSSATRCTPELSHMSHLPVLSFGTAWPIFRSKLSSAAIGIRYLTQLLVLLPHSLHTRRHARVGAFSETGYGSEVDALASLPQRTWLRKKTVPLSPAPKSYIFPSSKIVHLPQLLLLFSTTYLYGNLRSQY